ncbi:MAG: hypothetical protein H0Z32_15640 [Bacillaceae bacterium]|nr:hypothetical protein [Bacillaceae bacterium]
MEDVFEGENAFGAVLTALLTLADTIEKTDYQTAFASAKKTIDLKEKQNQHGYRLTVQKIELADEETRVYVKVTNDTSDKNSFYSFNTRIIVNG